MRIRFGGSGSVRSAWLIFMLLALWWNAAACGAQSGSGAAPKQTVTEKIAVSKDLLDINIATAEQLKALPGMGDAYVQRVIAARPYTAKNQLTTRGVLPAEEYERIRPLIVAHRAKK